MITYLSDSWTKIKEDAPSAESVKKISGGLVGIYGAVLIYHHRKPIYNYLSKKMNECCFLFTKTEQIQTTANNQNQGRDQDQIKIQDQRDDRCCGHICSRCNERLDSDKSIEQLNNDKNDNDTQNDTQNDKKKSINNKIHKKD